MIREPDLLRLIEGECTPQEAAAIQAWIAADPARGRLFDELRETWLLTGRTARRWDVGAARARLEEGKRTRTPPVEGARPHWSTRWPVRVAAAVAAVALGATLASLRGDDARAREYATAPGQRAELRLPDGTRVLLSVDTRLRVPAGYGGDARTVELSGQAYFVVRHDERRPFLVRTARGTAEDLGTAFDVRAYPDEPLVQVVVAEGIVALRGHGQRAPSLTLRPRDRGTLDAGGVAARGHPVPLDAYLSWTRGALLFDDAPLDSVLAELRRWYDVEIDASAWPDGERVTISFTTESADEALAALAKVLGARVVRSSGTVRLTPTH